MGFFLIVERTWGRNNSVYFSLKDVKMTAKGIKALLQEYFTLFSPERPLNKMEYLVLISGFQRVNLSGRIQKKYYRHVSN